MRTKSTKVRIKKTRGLPAKSYLHILTLDNMLKSALSFVVMENFFDLYISSNVVWRYRYPNREQTVKEFLDYMACYGADRIEFLIPSGVFPRSKAIEFLASMKNSIEKYNTLLEKPKSELSPEDFKYIFLARRKWGNGHWGLINSIPPLVSEINTIYTNLIKNYLDFVRKKLMERRRSEKNPDSLITDAYDALLRMVDNYDPAKSKVPFSNYLNYFIKEIKDKIIKTENWELETGAIVSIDDIFKEVTDEENQNSYRTKHQMPFQTHSHLNAFNDMDYRDVITELGKFLPKQYYELFVVCYEILDPLTYSEEAKLHMCC